MAILRKTPELNDAIAELNEVYRRAVIENDKSPLPIAWASLSEAQAEFIEHEISQCITDRRYYLENYHVITDEHGVLKTLYPFWDHQEMIYEVMLLELDEKGCCRIIVLKPRQCGGTVWAAGIIFHNTIFLPQAYNMLMSSSADTVQIIDQRITTAYDSLPWWMKPEILSRQQERHWIFQRLDPAQREITPGMGSTLLISNAQKMAGIAIGKTLRSIHMSEASRYPSANVYTSDIKPSLNSRDVLAIMESTAYGRRGLFYNQWRAAEKGQSEWTPIFIPVYRVRKYFIPLDRSEKFLLTPDEDAIKVAVKERENFTIPLGFFKWRRHDIEETINSTGSDADHYEAYPITPDEAFLASGDGAFPKMCLDQQSRQNVRDPKLIGEIRYTTPDGMPDLTTLHKPDPLELIEKPDWRNRFWVWEEPEPGDSTLYFIGADVSGGNSKDFSDAAVYRAGKTMQEPDVQVAEWHGKINPSHFAKILAALGNWYNRAEIAVEYANEGITTGNELVMTLDYPNIYRYKHLDSVTNVLTTKFHWATNSRTRPDMINRYNEALLDNTVVIRNRHLIDEMRDFVKGETGKIAGIDNNDDMPMANCIALSVLREYMRMNAEWSVNSASPTSSKLLPKAPIVYGIYDNLMRQLHQTDSKEKAEVWIKDIERTHNVSCATWLIRPIMVMKANTVWSPIFDGTGTERELHDKLGIPSTQITPSLVSSYRRSLPSIHKENTVFMDGDD